MTECIAGQNTNTINASNFVFLLSSNKLKNLEFRLQSFTGLGINLGEVVRYWNSLNHTVPGDSMIFNDLTLTALVDEDMIIIEDLYDYMFRIKDFDNNDLNIEEWTGTLFTSTNKNNYSKRFIFYNCWIKSFSDLNFSTTATDSEPLTVDLTVNYTYYIIKDPE